MHPKPTLFHLNNSFNQPKQPSHTQVRHTITQHHQLGVLLVARYFMIAYNVNMTAFDKQYVSQRHVLQETRDANG
jgi:hypothetical protein